MELDTVPPPTGTGASRKRAVKPSFRIVREVLSRLADGIKLGSYSRWLHRDAYRFNDAGRIAGAELA
jgi:hypothetical protein